MCPIAVARLTQCLFSRKHALEKTTRVLRVAFDAVQISARHKTGIAMRFPRIKRIQWDKPAIEADRFANLKRLIDATGLRFVLPTSRFLGPDGAGCEQHSNG